MTTLPPPAVLHARACALLGVDPARVPLVGPTAFKARTGRSVGRSLGRAVPHQRVIYVRRGQGLDTYLHELLHLLFPSRPHWWVYGAAYKLAGVRTRRWVYGAWQSADRVPESHARLRQLAAVAARRKGLAPVAPADPSR